MVQPGQQARAQVLAAQAGSVRQQALVRAASAFSPAQPS
ncbi:hypothetical protein KPSA3_00281 [Pseudomonas syringae pv. actinidiae]|uniref:Uncharacterized protein n=1 Tax=Pseudomonas syringae pv. actinidiae TaxID=103796 RepID=A0AAN4PZ92_PSESF|nr:hypothetical protein KPSA3_00281 [Pseudomonas syringae pv. actinidiae]